MIPKRRVISAVEATDAARGKRSLGEDIMPPVLEEDALIGGMVEGDCEDRLTHLLPWPTCRVCPADSLDKKSDI